MRSTGLAALQFFNEHDGEFFPTRFWELYPSWAVPARRGMRDYLGVESDLANINGVAEFYHDSIITCPALRRQYPDISMALHRCFSFNYYLNLKDPHSRYNALPSIQRPLLPNGYWKMQNVENPAAMWIFTDGIVGASGTYFATSISDAVDTGRFTFPHGGSQNFVFLDGHVENLTPEQLAVRSDDRDFWGKRN